MKPRERDEARRLRQTEGASLHSIAARLHVSVSSVSRWTRDIELTDAQHAALLAANPIYNQQQRAQENLRHRARAERLRAQDHGRVMAAQGNPLHQQGCMLYWGEGSKNKNQVRFTNSDVDMMRFFVRFLREAYAVPSDRILLTVNCYLNNGLGLTEIERWWLANLGLPQTSLRQAAVNRPSRASKGRRNTLLYGTARVTHHSTFVVQSIYGAIQQYAGTDRPEWLG